MKIPKDVISGSFMILFGVMAIVMSLTYPSKAAAFPRVASGIIIVLAVYLVIRGLLKREDKIEITIDYRIPVFMVLMFFYFVGISRFGFILCSIVFISVTYYLLGVRSIKIYLGGTFFVLFTNFVFSTLLRLRLPVGSIIRQYFF